MPIRIQRKRVKGWKMPENTVSVTRPGKWGNPFKVGQNIKVPNRPDWLLNDVGEVIKAYRWWLNECSDGILIRVEASKELRGKNLACFCKEGDPCHADILLELANPHH